MSPLSEDQGLQEAIRTTLAQLCKVGVNYQTELSLKGTIGLTIDKKEVILVHFNETLENGDIAVGSSQNCNPNLSNSGLSTASLGYCPVLSNQTLKLGAAGSRSSSIIKHTSLADFGKTMMNIEPSKMSSSLWQSYLLSNSDGVMKEPSSTFSDHNQLSTSEFTGRQIGKIEVPTTTSLSDRFGMDMTDRKGLLSLEETITIDLDSDSETFDTSLNFEEVDEKLECGDTEKKFYQKQEIIFSDDGDGLEPISDLDVKIKVFQGDSDSGPSLDMGEPDTGSLGKIAEQPSTSTMGKATFGNIPVFVTKSEILDAKQTWDEEHWYEGDCDTNIEMLSEADSLNWGKSKYYSCEVCGKQLPSIGKLEAHLIETHKLTESKEYGSIVFKQCSHCGKKFRFQATLDKHLFLHVAKRSFKCNLCSNNYCFPESLEIHMGAHTGNYSCKKCRKLYSTKTLFQKHIVYKHEQRQHSNKN